MLSARRLCNTGFSATRVSWTFFARWSDFRRAGPRRPAPSQRHPAADTHMTGGSLATQLDADGRVRVRRDG